MQVHNETRRLLLLGAAALAMATPLAALGAEPGKIIYGQELINDEIARHPEVAVLAMHVTPPKQNRNVIIAANVARMIGKPADNDDLHVVHTGIPLLAVNKAGNRYEVQLRLLDANRRPVGSLGVVFPYKPGDDKAAFQQQATVIRDELSRRISHTANLVEPAVLDSSIPTGTYAQHLVDAMLLAHPNVVIMALHTSTRDHPGYPIVASNIGRIGKKADSDDMDVINTGTPKLEMNETHDRFEVEQRLLDASGDTIGAVGVVYAWMPGVDKEPLRQEAVGIGAALAREISNSDNLLQAYPYDPSFNGNIEAATLLDSTLAANPDIEILAFHVTPPGGAKNLIIASNIGRLGKAADSDDMGVVNTGTPNLGINDKGNRFECELAFLDSSRHRIGAISIVFAYKPGDDKAALAQHATAIRDEVAKQVPSLDALFHRAS